MLKEWIVFKRLKSHVAAMGKFARERRLPSRFLGRSLVLGPLEPVDGDSVASTKGLIAHLRKQGKEAYTLPVACMYEQLRWILTQDDLHPASLPFLEEEVNMVVNFGNIITRRLQEAYDAVLAEFQPQEIVLLDGQKDWLGFDPRGVPVYIIDHHVGRGELFDAQNFVRRGPSCGALLIEYFGVREPILLVSLLTDTYWLRKNQPASAMKAMARLVEAGLTDRQIEEIQRQLMVRKDPAVMQELRHSKMDELVEAQACFVVMHTNDAELHREIVGQLGYFYRYICVVRPDGYASLATTDDGIDLAALASRFWGGGHSKTAAAHLPDVTHQTLQALREDFADTVRASLLGARSF
jgi:nanoRNase/pAp phosphatase (c-di-AMP/oligoRNAs hydrolase)